MVQTQSRARHIRAGARVVWEFTMKQVSQHPLLNAITAAEYAQTLAERCGFELIFDTEIETAYTCVEGGGRIKLVEPAFDETTTMEKFLFILTSALFCALGYLVYSMQVEYAALDNTVYGDNGLHPSHQKLEMPKDIFAFDTGALAPASVRKMRWIPVTRRSGA